MLALVVTKSQNCSQQKSRFSSFSLPSKFALDLNCYHGNSQVQLIRRSCLLPGLTNKQTPSWSKPGGGTDLRTRCLWRTLSRSINWATIGVQKRANTATLLLSLSSVRGHWSRHRSPPRQDWGGLDKGGGETTRC